MNFQEKYSIKPYNPKFKDYFRQERKYLQDILPYTSSIEHVGSTAIKGLEGKGIVDVYVTVPKNKLRETKDILRKHYLYVKGDGEPARYFFYKDYKKDDNNLQRVHVHLSYANSPDFRDKIKFRDILKTQPKVKEQYTEIKHCAFKDANEDGKKYKKIKGEFIKKIIKENSKS